MKQKLNQIKGSPKIQKTDQRRGQVHQIKTANSIRQSRREAVQLKLDSLAFQLFYAARIIAEVEEGRSLSELLPDRFDSEWPSQTRAAIQDFVYRTLRQYGRAFVAFQPYLEKPLPSPYNALLYVAFQRLESKRDEDYTIVDQSVEAVGYAAPGLRGVVNGVLRRVIREWETVQQRLETNEVGHWQHPAWWIRAIRARYPQQWQSILTHSNTPPPMCLRVNLQRSSVSALQAQWAAEGIESKALGAEGVMLSAPRPLGQLPGFAEGLFSVQDFGAQWAAHWLDIHAGQRILDACAAPGGKACHILEHTPHSQLTALELNAGRARRIQENFDRLGLQGEVLVGDVTQKASWWDGVRYDRILADVPCSGSGVVRRHPDIKWIRERQDVLNFAAKQAEILDHLWMLLAKNGKILYVTCSIFDEENAAQIVRFCSRHSDAKRLPIAGQIEQRFLPTTEHDGFYYALLQKIDG